MFSLNSLEQLAQAALPYWGIDNCTPELLKHRENTVFKITLPDDVPAVLRIHRDGYHNDAALLSELVWLRMLHEAGMIVPAPVATQTQQFFIHLDNRQIDILSWVDGEILGKTGEPLNKDRDTLRAQFYSLGEVTAMLHNLSDAWQLPENFTRHAWDLPGLLGETPFWGPFWNIPDLTAAEHSLINKARAVASQDLSRYQASGGDYGLIHADLVKENVLIADNKAKLIDFDDAGYGWRMFELATILIKHQAEPDYTVIEQALLAGYRNQRELHDSDLAALPLFFLLRSFTYLGWADARRNEPHIAAYFRYLIDDACHLADNYLTHRA